MKICLDIQPAITQRAGVGRYTKSLAENLCAAAEGHHLRLFFFDFLRKGAPFKVENAETKAVRWCPGRIAQKAWQTFNWPPFEFFAGDADVYHFPNFLLPPLRSGRSVVTIHDLSFLRLPEAAERRNLQYLKSRITDTIRRADAIITDSHFSADEIVNLLAVEPRRVHVTYGGITAGFAAPPRENISAVLSSLGLKKPYILTVGTLEPRKNIPFLVEVFEKIKAFDGLLVIAGMPGWKYGPIIERMQASPMTARIRYLNYIPEEQLPALYAGAELFMFASLYEGFGFPPLESMACGTPVISSPRGSLAEVLGSGAVLIDTFDSDLWADRAEEVLADQQCRKQLIAAGYQQASKYTWAETARKTLEVYKEAAR